MGRFGPGRLACLVPGLFLGLWCAGCAGQRSTTDASVESVAREENCPVVYVLAPGNYIVDLAANARVRLDPAWHEFELYCSLAEAGAALEADAARGGKSLEQWRIYTLDGDAGELIARENGRRVLKAPALLAGWENWPPQTK